jgi:hypothetical protein
MQINMLLSHKFVKVVYEKTAYEDTIFIIVYEKAAYEDTIFVSENF